MKQCLLATVLWLSGTASAGILIDLNADNDRNDTNTPRAINWAVRDSASSSLAIGDLTATAEVGKTYLGKVTRIVDFGAFVEIFPGTEGLLHISEISENRIRAVKDELKLGDQILVKCLALEGNKIRLSRRAVLREQRDKRRPKVAAE